MAIKTFVIVAVCVACGWLGGRYTAPATPIEVADEPEKKASPTPMHKPELVNDVAAPIPPPPAAEPCEPKETVKTVYVPDVRAAQAKRETAAEFRDKPTREDEQKSPFRHLKYTAVRPYREFRAYRGYAKEENAHGSEKDCQDRPYDVRCLGTLAFCSRDPQAPACIGTRVHCLKDPSDKACRGTATYCKGNGADKYCIGTEAGCLHDLRRPECLGMLESCEASPGDEFCFGTATGCSRGKYDQDLCSPDDK